MPTVKPAWSSAQKQTEDLSGDATMNVEEKGEASTAPSEEEGMTDGSDEDSILSSTTDEDAKPPNVSATPSLARDAC